MMLVLVNALMDFVGNVWVFFPAAGSKAAGTVGGGHFSLLARGLVSNSHCYV